jgi:hypothetical protein
MVTLGTLAFLSIVSFQGPAEVPKVAILPWTLKDGTETANKTAKDVLVTLFEKSRFEVVSSARVLSMWENEMGEAPVKEILNSQDALPAMPQATRLLELGKKLGVDLVCAGRADWHTKSVWVALGPKTKAECTVDVMIIDVKKQEIILQADAVKGDSTRTEKGLETAGALLVSFGITALSGGPKTPHQQRAATNAIAKSMEPWLRTQAAAGKKIGG